MYAVFAIAFSRQVLPLVVAAVALGAFLLGYVGMLSPAFDILAHFTAHWLVIAIMAVVASFVTRRAYALLAMGGLLAGMLPVILAAWYANDLAVPLSATAARAATPSDTGRAGETASASRRHFKVLTFNTLNPNTNLAAIWAEVQRHDADVVVMLELGPNKKALRQRIASRYPYYRTCETNWNCAIGLFSRLPVRRFEVVGPHDDAGPKLISAEVGVGAQRVTVVGVHILSPNHGPRANYLELDHLAERVRRIPGPVVVAGDLNTTLWANAFDNFRRKSGLVYMGHLIPTWPTWPLPTPQIGIDHIFASPDLQLSGVAAGRPAGSDHLPLVATVSLR
ncbi:MAG: endonuclease/exonuclease/phosphatase family protein [Hyphomicrobiaceae bacterium]